MANCRALILYVGAGALQEALAALREAQQPDTAAMFIHACREIYAEIIADLGDLDDESSSWALILYVGAGALQEALALLNEAQQPDKAAMFILA
nr:hypothetical protein CFP56_51705 [Quercus suber]